MRYNIFTRCKYIVTGSDKMPKVSEEHKAERKKEIIDACEKIYKEQGFYGVTIKGISTETSFTRPAIYSYFETKDEILLALLNREYEKWCDALDEVAKDATGSERSALADRMAKTLEEREILLRIQNMNLFEIELNSRTERLAEFKVLYRRMILSLMAILKSYKPDVTDEECDVFSRVFSSFLFGVYPFVYHTEKQLEAMRMANVPHTETTIPEMAYQCLVKILP